MTHGTYSGYKHHRCRCEACKQANYRYMKALRVGRSAPRLIDATGTRRRLDALYAMGWSQRHLAARLGVRREVIYRYTTQPRIRPVTAARIAALYDELAMTPGPSRETRGRAHAAHLPGPLCWDEHTIDDPAAGPDWGAEHRDPGTGSRIVHLDDLEFLLTHEAHTTTTLATRLGVTRDAITQACRRAGRRDLLDRMHRNQEGTAA